MLLMFEDDGKQKYQSVTTKIDTDFSLPMGFHSLNIEAYGADKREAEINLLVQVLHLKDDLTKLLEAAQLTPEALAIYTVAEQKQESIPQQWHVRIANIMGAFLDYKSEIEKMHILSAHRNTTEIVVVDLYNDWCYQWYPLGTTELCVTLPKFWCEAVTPKL